MPLKNNILCALFAALLAICAWLSLPVADISFTMQTFGVFTALGLLGGKRGTLSIALYLLLGIAGLPVFAGFQGGLGVLLGSTGGYIWGFLLAGLVYWTIIKLLQESFHELMPLVGEGLSCCRVHPVFQQEQLVIEMLNGCGLVLPFRVVNLSAAAAAEGKGSADADGTDCI